MSSTNDIDPLASMLLHPNLNNPEAKENKDSQNLHGNTLNNPANNLQNAKLKAQSIFEMNVNRF